MEIYFFNSTHPDSSVIAQPEFLSFSKSMGHTRDFFNPNSIGLSLYLFRMGRVSSDNFFQKDCSI